MTTPDMNLLTIYMLMILIINLLTTKTSIMCINLIAYIMTTAMIMSMKMKLTPIPFIVFLTMIGGLMIIFLYLAATLWTKKEKLTLKTKVMILSTMLIPMYLYKSSTVMVISNQINLFNNNINKITIMLIILLTIMLVATIEIHMKLNNPFRRKLKIWA